MKTIIKLSVIGLLAARAVHAQQVQPLDQLSAQISNIPHPVVKTISLHHLSNADAVTLLTPYIMGRGIVSSAGTSIHAITIRASAATLADAERILSQYDRSPLTVSLTFQLIAADNSGTRDGSLAGLDSVLRGVLKFSGYHLLTSAVVDVADGSTATQNLSAGGQEYRLMYEMYDINGQAADATAHMKVSLQRVGIEVMAGGMRAIDPQILSTGVTIPIGHTVVLGSTVEHGKQGASDRALILTVRPQLAPGRAQSTGDKSFSYSVLKAGSKNPPPPDL